MDGVRWVAVQAGARWLNKRWPVEYFTDLVARLAAAHQDLNFALIGGKSDRELGAAISQGSPGRCLELAGQTTLPEMVEWIRASDFLISNEYRTLAYRGCVAQTRARNVRPHGTRRSGPYGQIGITLKSDLPCAPCFKSSCSYEKPMECLRAMPSSLVYAKAEELMASIR